MTAPLLTKIEDLNYKQRKESQRALLSLYNHTAMDQTKLVEAIMEPIGKKGQKPEKTPERVLLGRLELMLYLAMNKEN